ncbi:MAG: DinB superfamily protein [Ignavibacteria bacterium GWA2_35_9]|nr:MAG: DinB superfamily protein [Ignavibacteria bacterium GWA2_35_9]OGU52701.1 MAG: DinB superfamily protein [Ignavibacteria bacterium GWC2_36_12]
MFKKTIREIFIRDLNKLKSEIELYKNESDIWVIAKEIKNSAGTLCIHLNGNLKHFIGAILGGTDYKRDRDSEFTIRNISKTELLKSTSETIEVVDKTLSSLSEEKFFENYPVEFRNEIATTDFVLVYLAAHFNYHLGQVNYHRRLIG